MTVMRSTLKVRQLLAVLCMLMSLPAWGLTQVNLQLRWHHQFQFAGYYAAKEQGFYSDKGLEVFIHAGAPGKEPVLEVIAGRAEFGIANSEILFQRLHNNQPLIALAAVFQHSPSALLVKQSSGITSPQDFTGQRIMLVGKEDDIELLAMMHNEGLDTNQLTLLPSSYDIQDLIDDKTDAFNAYITNEPFYLQEQGIPYILIQPNRYGVDFYSDLLFTTETLKEHDPELVRNFRDASLKGWRYALDHPDEVIQLIKTRYASPKSVEHLRFEYEQMRALILPEMIELGHINPGRIVHMADTLVEQKIIPANYSLDGFLYQANGLVELEKWRIRALLLGLGLGCIVLLALLLLYLNRKLTANIIRRRAAETEMHRQKALFEAIFNSLPDAALVTSTDGTIHISNPAFSRVFGYRPEEITGMPIAKLSAPDSDALPLTSDLNNSFEQLFQRKNKSIFPGEPHSGLVLIEAQTNYGYIHLIRDITELKQQQQEITRLAMTDPLTELANRRKFHDGLLSILNIASRQQYKVAIVAIDLDHFKQVNDEHGHSVGDQLLIQVAKQLRETFRTSDLVARLGGDEFAVVMINPGDREAIETPLKRLIENFNQQVILENKAVQIGVSFGVSLYPEDSTIPEQLLRFADKALYQSKHRGRNCFYFYSELDDN